MQHDRTQQTDRTDDHRGQVRRFGRKLSLIAGGSALVWLGLALMLDLGLGAGLLGAGLILAAEQGARVRFGLRLDAGWLVGAGIAVLAGALMLAGVDVPTGALILVGLGLVVALSAFARSGK